MFLKRKPEWYPIGEVWVDTTSSIPKVNCYIFLCKPITLPTFNLKVLSHHSALTFSISYSAAWKLESSVRQCWNCSRASGWFPKSKSTFPFLKKPWKETWNTFQLPSWTVTTFCSSCSLFYIMPMTAGLVNQSIKYIVLSIPRVSKWRPVGQTHHVQAMPGSAKANNVVIHHVARSSLTPVV